MKIILAKNGGFCPGVKSAIDKVIELSKTKKKKIYTLGPLIHNKDVIKSLEEQNIFSVNSVDEIKEKNATVVIRAHGIPPELEKKLKEYDLEVIDATCPLVKKVHRIIDEYYRKGYTTVILGDREHAEVIGLIGYARDRYYVISSKEEAEKLPFIEKINFVSQTTQEEALFYEVAEILKNKTNEIVISNTICNPTRQRQKETTEFSKMSDLVIVIGGKHSANTQRLYQICKNISKNAIHIENADEISYETIKDYEDKTVFITAGASTPNWIIEEVYQKIKEISHRENTITKILRYLIAVGVFTGFAGFGLSLYNYHIYRSPYNYTVSIAIALALMSVHIVNRITERKTATKYLKNIITAKYNSLIKYSAYISAISSLVITYRYSLPVFILLLLFLSLSFTYTYIRIKSSPPLVKDILLAFGWTFTVSFIPAYDLNILNNSIFLKTVITMYLITLARTVLIGLSQKQNDIITSNENLAIYLGDRKTLILLSLILSYIFFYSLFVFRDYFLISLSLYYSLMVLMLYGKKINNLVIEEFLIETPFIILIFILLNK